MNGTQVLDQLAKSIARRLPPKVLKQMHGHAVAISRLHVHGILMDAEARKCNSRIVSQIISHKKK